MASPFGNFNPLLKVTCGVQFPLSTCDDRVNVTLYLSKNVSFLPFFSKYRRFDGVVSGIFIAKRG